MESPTASHPGPFKLAVFSDVPYILDSLWRWGEFRANRLGRVSLTGSHPFEVLGTTPAAFFAPYAVITSFLVFGPTFTTLCTSFGREAAEIIRVTSGVLLLAATALLLGLLISSLCSRLARRAAKQLAKDRSNEDLSTNDRGVAQVITAVAAGVRHPIRAAPRVWTAIRKLPRAVGGAAHALRSLTGATRLRLAIAFSLLLLGAGLIVLPPLVAGVSLVITPYDADSCGRPHDSWRGLAQVAVFGSLLAFGYWLWRWKEPARGLAQLLYLVSAWACATLILWYAIAASDAREATGGPYPQTFIILLGCLLVIALGARHLARRVLRGVSPDSRRHLQGALAETELFDSARAEPDMGRMRILASFVNGSAYHPLHLLLFPSLVAISLPTQVLLPYVLLSGAVTLMLLAHGSIATRWEALIVLVDRWFLSGTPLLVSIAAMVLAVSRLLDVQYVSTILDAAPFGVIFTLVITAYSTLWFFEYWVNRWLAEGLLGILGAGQNGLAGHVAYRYFPPEGTNVIVSLEGRDLSLHGTGQFCVQGWFRLASPAPGENPLGHAFTTYRLTELFNVLGRKLNPEIAHDIERRVRFYFALVNIALLLAAGGLAWWQWDYERPLAAYRVVDANDGAAFETRGGDLQKLLAEKADQHRPALIVAASGGGTRAALYTATALEGLAKLDRTQDVVLLSGVSGGGLAVAYFANSFDSLGRDRDSSADAWGKFKHRVTEPFIEDVLDGVGELRVAANVPLGELLAESFDRRVFDGPTRTLGQLHGPALILNTTISGHPWPDSELLKDHVGVIRPEDSCLDKSQPFASLAGSRLIFTNLANLQGFPRPPMIMADVGLTYKIVRDSRVPLATAAALNANFPPVFSNARVRLTNARVQQASDPQDPCQGYSYFVTDGGATENLGLVSALYALRGVLETWPRGQKLPQIDIVAIEASAITYDYDEDRGVGAATGGSKERINGALTAELIKSINTQLSAQGGPSLRLHYLPLPVAFRSRGGFGTHWMYANTIRVTNPLVPKIGNRLVQWWRQWSGRTSFVVLQHEDIDQLWTSLFDGHKRFCDAGSPVGVGGVAEVTRWVCGIDPDWHITAQPDLQICAWQNLVNDLSLDPTPPDPKCSIHAAETHVEELPLGLQSAAHVASQ